MCWTNDLDRAAAKTKMSPTVRRPRRFVPMHSRSESYSVNIALWSTGYFLKLTYRASFYSFLLSSGINYGKVTERLISSAFPLMSSASSQSHRWLLFVTHRLIPNFTELTRRLTERVCKKHFLRCFLISCRLLFCNNLHIINVKWQTCQSYTGANLFLFVYFVVHRFVVVTRGRQHEQAKYLDRHL